MIIKDFRPPKAFVEKVKDLAAMAIRKAVSSDIGCEPCRKKRAELGAAALTKLGRGP